MKQVLDQLLDHIETEHRILGDEQPEMRWLPMVDLFKRDIHNLLVTGNLTEDEGAQAETILLSVGQQEQPLE